MNSNKTSAIKEAISSEILETLLPALHKPRFTIRDSDVGRRNIAHWGDNELLIGEFEPGKWRRFTYLEVIWLRMVAHMRSFDVPLEKIKKVKDAICAETIPLEVFCQELGISMEDMGQKQETRISSLTSMFIQTILFRYRFVVIVTRGGEVKSLNLDTSDQSIGFLKRHDLSSKTFLSLSLTEVMLDSFSKIDVDTLSQLFVLTTAEAEVISLLRDNKLMSVHIALDDGRETDLFDLAGEKDVVTELLNLIWRQGYHRITWESKDGRVTYFDWPDRFKLKPGLPVGGSSDL